MTDRCCEYCRSTEDVREVPPLGDFCWSCRSDYFQYKSRKWGMATVKPDRKRTKVA